MDKIISNSFAIIIPYKAVEKGMYSQEQVHSVQAKIRNFKAGRKSQLDLALLAPGLGKHEMKIMSYLSNVLSSHHHAQLP